MCKSTVGVTWGAECKPVRVKQRETRDGGMSDGLCERANRSRQWKACFSGQAKEVQLVLK